MLLGAVRKNCQTVVSFTAEILVSGVFKVFESNKIDCRKQTNNIQKAMFYKEYETIKKD